MTVELLVKRLQLSTAVLEEEARKEDTNPFRRAYLQAFIDANNAVLEECK